METDEVCAICLGTIDESECFQSACARPHFYHMTCIHDYAKHGLASAVAVHNGAVVVKHAALARCPMCRTDMTWAHRCAKATTFFLVGGKQVLLELGTVRDAALELSAHSYKRAPALA